MKRFRPFLFIIVLIIMGFAGAVPVMAAGTVTTAYAQVTDTVWSLTYTCTGDSSDGSFPATASQYVYGYVVRAVTNPGATAPTASYDITITDSEGCDVMGGELGNRSASASEQVLPKLGNAYDRAFVSGPLTLNITNNSVNSAIIVVVVYIELPRY